MQLANEIEYREIEGSERFRVGSDGSVWSRRTKFNQWNLLSQYRRPYGAKYMVVCLRLKPKAKVVCRYVHHLVLEAFVGVRPSGLVACHNNGDTTNNNLANLRWDTQKSNIEDKKSHGTHGIKLTNKDVLEIRSLGSSGTSTGEIARKFSVNRSTILRILSKKQWKHV